mmetsp:Transcript_57073/g.170102  ORF Transcript_57073/g.170102 Transcript_57073/m.170102 type:complete len:95 (-) Transcript_57073:29-313(-)
MGRRSKVVEQDLEGGGTVFVHASDHMIHQSTLEFQVCGKDINFGHDSLLGSKTNTYYEIRNAIGYVCATLLDYYEMFVRGRRHTILVCLWAGGM